MLILFYILASTYIVSINVYGVLILNYQKKERADTETCNRTISDGKLFLTALLGGALAIYVFMFIFKYRLKNFTFMVFMPILSVLNIYIFALIFTSNFGFLMV